MTQFFQKTKELFFKSLLPILVSLFFVVAVIYAVWTEPEVAPPDGNVDAPLNVGSVSQQKIGPLILNTGGAATGLIVDQGNVGIGTTNPGAKLEIAGQIKITGGTPGAGQVLTTLDASGLATWEIPAGGSGFWTASGANIYNLNSGNVGIGTASPSQKLHVSVSSGNVAQRLSSGTNNAYWAVAGSSGSYSSIAVAGDVVLRSDGGDLILQGRNAGDIFFTTGNPDSVKMTILNSGNVGIGLSGPSQLLHIDGIVQAATFYASTGVSTFGTSIINPGVVKATSFCLDDGETNCVSGTWPSGGAGLWTASGANIYNSNSGNVGIGDTTPTFKLDITGNLRATTDIRADDDLIFFGELMPDGVTCSNGQILKRTGSNNWDCAADDTGGSGLWTASGANIYNSNSGNVGIGATSPTIDLAIGDNDSGLNSTGDGVLDLWANGGARVQVRDTRVTVTNDLYIGSQRVCREDGTGCPARVVSTCTASVMPTVCTATCPAGYEVTGGGMNNALSGGTIISFDSFPNSDTSWVCGLNATFGATNSMTCYAVCRRQ
ncbi:hypothetical protein IH779_00495 [Patescibacteria group bacterium]|nr:hypothetical protein [Patescibacteria group bacterium]